MTNPGNVLVWRNYGDWKQRILDLMSEFITPEVIENVRADPPGYCHWEDEDWQRKALIQAGIRARAPLAEILADRLPQSYDYIRAYHACRPSDTDGYYANGILPADSKWLNDLAAEIFLPLPGVNKETLARACEVVEKQGRGGHIFFSIDSRILTLSSPNYLEFGSEYLQVIAVELRKITGENCPDYLQSIGVPTIFVCDLPIADVQISRLRNLSGKLVECLFEEYVRPQWVLPRFNLSFKLSDKLPPSLIITHCHPT